MRKDLIKL
jgi:hypothetical protein